MQLMPPRSARASRVSAPAPAYSPAELIEILDEFYGRAPAQASGDPIAELVLTLLSQHTSDYNSGRAFHRLLERFQTWDEVIASATSEVEEAIRPGGLAPTK